MWFNKYFLQEGEGEGGAAGGGAAGQGSGGGGDGGPGAGAGAGAGAGPGAGGGGDPWASVVQGLSEEDRGFLEIKGFKDLPSLANAYRNYEKLQGVPQDELFRIPKDRNEEGMAKVWQALGAPEAPEAYKELLLDPKSPDKGANEFGEAMAPIFHNAKLTVDQAKALTEGWNEYASKAGEKSAQDYAASLELEKQGLQKEWGANYENRLGLAKSVMQEFGVPSEVVAKLEEMMGFTDVMKFMATVGEKIGEDTYRGGDGGEGDVTTPEGARAQIASLKADKDWVAKYMNGDANARATMERLQRLANPGTLDLANKQG